MQETRMNAAELEAIQGVQISRLLFLSPESRDIDV